MGKALAERSPAAARAFEEASEALGWDLRELCWEGPAERLELTSNAQPAIGATPGRRPGGACGGSGHLRTRGFFRGFVRIAEQRRVNMIADVFPGKPINKGIDKAGNKTADPAPQRATDHPRYRADFFAGHVAVKGRHNRDVLEGIDDIDNIAEPELFLFPQSQMSFRFCDRRIRIGVARLLIRDFGRDLGK